MKRLLERAAGVFRRGRSAAEPPGRPVFAPRAADAPAAAEADLAARLADPGTSFAPPAVAVAGPPPPATPAAPPPVVEFRGVTKTFANGFTAIRDVTFTVEDLHGKGEFVAVLGPSGCGKSTILRLIAGLGPHHPPTQGQVLVAGRPVEGAGADRGMVFQDYTSFDHRTVLDNIAFGLECRGVPRREREERAREWIGRVGLSVERDQHKYPHQLSGGMRQRVAIARSLILSPRIMLMDEPFGALDPATRLNMQDLLVQLWREAHATVFFITHSVEEAVYLGDRVYIMSPCPGTILEELKVPPPDFPAREMQRHPDFLELVFDIRDKVERLEESTRAGT
jgi:NitT/TauT family transport system ATP-binding protein